MDAEDREIVMRFAGTAIARTEPLMPGWVADLLEMLAEAEDEAATLRRQLDDLRPYLRHKGHWCKYDGEFYRCACGLHALEAAAYDRGDRP